MIRLAQHNDWSAIVRLLDQLDYPDTAKFMETRLAQLLNDPAEVLLVWEDGPHILGFLSLHFIPQIALESDFARISYFSIDETARSKGIGRAMEEHATQLAREKGCGLIEVHCHTRREKAHAFYFRQGYEESPKYLIKRL
ncbi:MAG TPA: GNAT family N-acetyltransferase [Puia sp.]|jgi:GNAT superfamily N-acetyltransferase|nr:GNAT family N-acetyltransferase [Puia sp.]